MLIISWAARLKTEKEVDFARMKGESKMNEQTEISRRASEFPAVGRLKLYDNIEHVSRIYPQIKKEE